MQLNDKLHDGLQITHVVDGIETSPQLLVASNSYLIDRIVPNHEFITLPPVVKTTGEIQVTVSKSPVEIAPKNLGRKAKLLNRLGLGDKPVQCHDGSLYFDYRMVSPENWSHALNLHIPYAYFIRDLLLKNNVTSDIVFLLPKDTPKYISDLFDAFKLRTLATNATVSAMEIRTRREDWGMIQVGRHRWVKDIVIKSGVIDELRASSTDLPKKIFLSRKSTRALGNEAEIQKVLEGFGYELVYPEDLSATDQVALFLNAESIVAIHGAGMGPLLYTSGNLSSVVEIFTPGHMSEHYRAMCDLLGIPWLGLRGNIAPEHARDAYTFSKKFRAHSLSEFQIESSTVRFVMENLDRLITYQPQLPVLVSDRN